MDKLCSLKDLIPGSVIRLPEGYRDRDDETAVVLGLEYASDKKRISTSLLRRSPTQDFVATSLPTMVDDSKLELVADLALQRAVSNAFNARKLSLPDVSMSMGCDPEVFCEHADGAIFPAWEYMPDEAIARKNVKEWAASKGFEEMIAKPESNVLVAEVPAYWDGAQAEFAPWAKGCLETLHCGTRAGLLSVLTKARAVDPKAKLTLRNVVELPEDVLKNADDKHIQFRCSESYNIYNDPGTRIQDARGYKYRCAGGHIHVGFSRAFTAPGIEQIVRGLDAVLGVIGVSLATGIDNPERRHTYGRAGEFRLPQHGLEYRVLSNFWLSHPAIAMLVFELARATVRLAESGLFNLCWQAEDRETREVINNCDVDEARKILLRNKDVINGMLHGIWTAKAGVRDEADLTKMRKLAKRAIIRGIGAVIADPFDIEGNWDLSGTTWKHHCQGQNHSWLSLARKQA